ncbi:unnamed protein product [Discula destructiva]
MGLIGVAYTTAVIIGPLVGGAFSDRVRWRWCFYINLPIGFVAVAAIVFLFHNPAAAKSTEVLSWTDKLLHMDPVGIVLTMGAIISFILALQYGGHAYPWNSSQVISLVVGFVLMATALVFWEFFQRDKAMLPFRLLKRRSLWAPAMFQFFFAGCYFLLLYYLPIYFQRIKSVDAIKRESTTCPLLRLRVWPSSAVASLLPRQATPLVTVAFGLLYTLDVDTSSSRWIGYPILAGFFITFPFQNAPNVAQTDTAADAMATVTAALYFFQVLGGAFSVSAAQSAFVNVMVAHLPADVDAPRPS